MTDSDALVTVHLGSVGGAIELPPGGKGLVMVWLPSEKAWRGIFVHSDRHQTTHTGRPGQGPHSTFRQLADKCAWELEQVLNASAPHDFEASLQVDAANALEYEQARDLAVYEGAPQHLGAPPK